MALSEKTVNKHNIKRAEVFAANGLCDLDVAFAHPSFDGHGAAECILCGKTNLKWLFSIRFDAPDALTALGKITTEITRTEEVTLAVVGSKCITDWLDAVPESKAKLEALKRWDKEMKKANAAKAKKAVLAKLNKHGFDDQPALSNAIYAVLDQAKSSTKLGWYLRKALKKYASSTKWSRVKSAGTIKKIIDLLNEATEKLSANTLKAAAPATVATVVEQDDPQDAGAYQEPAEEPADDLAHLDDEIRALIVRGRDAYKAGLVDKNLTADHKEALIDIANKLKSKGSFASDKQRRFFMFLLIKAEGPKEKKAKATTSANALDTSAKVVLPGDEEFVSASGLAGARY